MNDKTPEAKLSNGAARATEAIMREAVRPLPKRFYRDVTVAETDSSFAILLDGRKVRTPRKQVLTLPSQSLAADVAREWSAQVDVIDPAKMPLTTLVFTAVDAVAGSEEAVAAEIVKYAGSDLLCYRAESPVELVRTQALHWDPVLRWAEQTIGARFIVATGMMPVDQPAEVATAVAQAIAGLPTLKLAGLHVLTTMMGSAILALAVCHGHLSLDAAWAAAHVDEDWQIAQWGEDAEAQKRREVRLREARAAAAVLAA